MNVEITSKKAKATTISDSLGNFSIVCLEKDIIMIKPKAFRPVNQKVSDAAIYGKRAGISGELVQIHPALHFGFDLFDESGDADRFAIQQFIIEPPAIDLLLEG